MSRAVHGLAVPAARPAAERAAAAAVIAADRVGWPVKLFILSLLLPTVTSINVGPLRLSPYRIVLILLAPAIAHGLMSGRLRKLVPADVLLPLAALWASAALLVHHGPEQTIEPAGVYALELLGAYFLARLYVNSAGAFRGLVSFLLKVLCVLLPFVVLESLTGRHLMQEFFAAALGRGFSSDIGERFGLSRAYGPFDHPILWGVFAASCIGMFWYRYADKNPLHPLGLAAGLMPALGAITSVSSGAMAAISLQLMLIVWERATRPLPHRWVILSVGIVLMYVLVDMVSNRSGMAVMLYYLTFSAHTAYNRIIIWEWGFWENAWPNPVFGIGINEWVRPSWMHSTSMDNFWLVQMVTYGLPCFVFLAGAALTQMWRAGRESDPATAGLRMGWVISMVGLVVSACTVHFWNTSFVWLALLMGITISSGARARTGLRRTR